MAGLNRLVGHYVWIMLCSKDISGDSILQGYVRAVEGSLIEFEQERYVENPRTGKRRLVLSSGSWINLACWQVLRINDLGSEESVKARDEARERRRAKLLKTQA